MVDRPQPQLPSTAKFAKLTASGFQKQDLPSSARVSAATHYHRGGFQMKPKIEIGQNPSVRGGFAAPMSMRSTSVGFGGNQLGAGTQYKGSPRATSPRLSSGNNQSMFSNESLFKESALYNHGIQYQLQKDHQLRVREMQLRKKYEGIDQQQLKLLLPPAETPFPFRTSPLMTPLQEPLNQSDLQVQTQKELFSSLGQKKQMNYVNFSMERYNLITHQDLSRTNKQDPIAQYHSNFFDKRVNYDGQKLTIQDTKLLKPELTQHFNILAAKRLNDPTKRQEIQDNRRAVSMQKKYHIVRNIQDIKFRAEMTEQEKRQSSTQEVQKKTKALLLRNPGDPIINSRRPFQVSNFMNVYDNLDQRIAQQESPDLPEPQVSSDHANSKVIFHRRANTSLQLQAPEASFPLNRSYVNPLPSKKENMDFMQQNQTQRPQTQEHRITFKALRQLAKVQEHPQQEEDGGDGHPVDQIRFESTAIDKDRLSEILDSLKPTKKVSMHAALQGISADPSPRLDHIKLAMMNQKISPSNGQVGLMPLGMTEAAISKRLKNLEEFINSKKRARDRDDAISVASQVLDTLSKVDGGRSQTSQGFNKDRFKLNFQVLKQPVQSRTGATIATITEEKASARIEGPSYIEGCDIVLDDELLMKLNINTSRGAAAGALISTNRRSPRYVGEYDETEDDEGKKTYRQEDTVQTTVRAKDTSRHKQSKIALKKQK